MNNGIKKLEKVWCSLNLGYVYNLSYSFESRQGIKMSLFFVNDGGVYDDSFLRIPASKVQVKIGNVSFNLVPISINKTTSFDTKTARVDLVDETYTLNNYYIALTGRGCGKGVYQLGRTVDNRTDQQKKLEDPDLFTIKQFTTFEDIEYNFAEFVDTLKKVYSVSLLTNIDNTITRDYSGTFKNVLESWCSYLGFSYFFENGVLKIFNPNSLVINFPSVPASALNSEESTSIDETYDRTAWNYFADEGGEVTIDSNSDYNTKGLQLYQIMNLFDLKLKQPEIVNNSDLLNQLVAAQYGQEFWFIYNIKNGTASSVCGFESSLVPTEINADLSNWRTALSSSKAYKVALLNTKKFQENFQFYKEYGDRIQGRLYVSNSINGVEQFENFSWYDQGVGQIFNIDILKQQPSPQLKLFKRLFGQTNGVLEGTEINSIYQGAVADGQRFYYLDPFERDVNFFELTDPQKSSILYYFKKFSEGVFGNAGLDYGEGFEYILYEDVNSFSGEIDSIIEQIPSKKSYFNYRRTSLNLKGVAPATPENKDFNPINDTKVTILDDSFGVVSNVSTIKAYVDSDLVAFYSKYEDCKSASTNQNAFNRQFFPRNISDDIPISTKYTKESNGALEIKRDFSYFEQVSKSDILNKIAVSYTAPKKTLSFSLNYFDTNIPASFLSNGLVGININFQQDGMIVTYNYSNEMLIVPFTESESDLIARNIKNSWQRTYEPKKRFATQ
jgi:hypothetical protein